MSSDETQSSAPARRGRPRRGTQALSRPVIVTATLDLVAAQGVDAIGLRAVARHLGVDAKSLYNHVDGKDGLLDAVAEHVLGGIELPVPTGDPAEDLSGIAHAFRRSALAHPQAAALVLTRQLSSFEALAPVDAVLAALADAGLAVEESVHLLRMFVATVVGALLREVQAGPTFGVDDAAGIAAREGVLTSSELPAVRRAASELARFDAEAEFRFAVDRIVAVALAAH